MTEYKHNLVGKKFGKLTVISFSGRRGNNHNNYTIPVWNCICDCGKTLEVKEPYLKSGDTKSCGCLISSRESPSKTHGMSRTRQNKIWRKMKDRCSNIRNPDYSYYGGRGISYDPKWETFEGFWEDMGDSYSETLTLDRVDNNKGYCKENCRWVDRQGQSRNQRKKKSNKSGQTGVWFNKRSNLWTATWSNLSQKSCSKSFSINKYGEELAFFMACEYREQVIMLLNLQGAGYGEEHGK